MNGADAVLSPWLWRVISQCLIATDRYFVFATAIGGPINSTNVARNFAVLIRRTRVPAIRFHDLRHTDTTWLLDSGQPVKVRSERLGHSTTTITLDTYAHAPRDVAGRGRGDHRRAARRRIGVTVGPSLTNP